MNHGARGGARVFVSFVVILLITLLGAPGEARERPRALTILYFNDMHGHLEPWRTDGNNGPTVGGIARMASVVARIRRENQASGRATILLVAGDVLQGTPMSAVFQGEPDFKAFNRMRVDAMAIGNHDFDFGQANLRKLRGMARFPVLGANVFTHDNRPFAKATTVLEPLPGLRVGVLGLTTVDTPTMTFPTNVTGLRFDDPVATARKAVPSLAGQCDLVVALTHLGVPEDRRLAREVPEVDVVIGGHTHAPLPEPERVGDTVICQAHDNGRFLGRLDLTIEKGRAKVSRAELIPITDDLDEDRGVAAIVAGYSNRLNARLSGVVGRSRVLLDGEREHVRTRETTLGNFVTDLMREAAHTDVAITNGGSLRASIGAGRVTYGDVLTSLPFNNTVVAIEAPGRTLRTALDYAASLDPAELPGAFLQISGLSYAIEKGRAVDIRVGDAPLDDERVYSVALPDFMLLGGDGYGMFASAARSRTDTGILLNGLVLDFFRKGKEASPRIEGRIVRR